MEFQIGFTDKEITPWGGMALMKKMLDQSKIDDLITSIEFSEPGSNSGYRAEQIIKSFWVSVWSGANRFLHTEVTRHDDVIRCVYGWKRICVDRIHIRGFSRSLHKG